MKRKVIKLNKRSEMIGQIFIYSLSLIIVTTILIFGYSSIRNFVNSGNAVELAKFKRDTQTYVNNYVTEFGSVGYKKLRLPKGADSICITDYNTIAFSNLWCSQPSNPSNVHPYFVDYFSAGNSQYNHREKKNFFLFDTDEKYIDGWYVGNITLIQKPGIVTPNCNLLCITDIGNGINIKIIGKGNHAEITNADWT